MYLYLLILLTLLSSKVLLTSPTTNSGFLSALNRKKNNSYQCYTGCPDQIGRNFETILHNQKVCRKYKDSFGIVRKRAIKYVFG